MASRAWYRSLAIRDSVGSETTQDAAAAALAYAYRTVAASAVELRPSCDHPAIDAGHMVMAVSGGLCEGAGGCGGSSASGRSWPSGGSGSHSSRVYMQQHDGDLSSGVGLGPQSPQHYLAASPPPPARSPPPAAQHPCVSPLVTQHLPLTFSDAQIRMEISELESRLSARTDVERQRAAVSHAFSLR